MRLLLNNGGAISPQSGGIAARERNGLRHRARWLITEPKRYRGDMLITLAIDLSDLSEPKGEELGRILRYWGGNAKALDLSAPTEIPLMDSAYQEVGTLKIE